MQATRFLTALFFCSILLSSPTWARDPSLSVEVRQCNQILARILTVFELPQVFEIALGSTGDLTTLNKHLPTQGLRKIYFQLSSSSIEYFSKAYKQVSPEVTHYDSTQQFLASLKKNRIYNFVWFKNGVLRFSEEGRTVFRILAAKHIVLAAGKKKWSEDEDSGIVAAGEMGLEADGTLFFNDATGTFYDPQNLAAIKKLVQQLQQKFSMKARIIPWNYIETLRAQIHEEGPVPPAAPGAIVDSQGEIGFLREIRAYWQRYLTSLKGANHYKQRREQRPDNLQWNQYKIEKWPRPEMAKLNADIMEVIKNHPELTPVIGPEPSWSYPAHALMKQKGKGIVLTKMTAAFILARAREYIPTGLEEALEETVARYQGPPIWPAQLFEVCYVLAQGDLFKALLTCHNVLVTNSRLVNRQETGIHPKLAYIRADSLPLGDNFGAWYHLFGIASFALQRTCGFSKLTGFIETFGSRLVGPADHQEELMNKLGVRLGEELKKIVYPDVPIASQDSCEATSSMMYF